MAEYVTGTGQVLRNIHSKSLHCVVHGCVIHNPTDHAMSGFPTHYEAEWRVGPMEGRMTRKCPHGVKHPDPDAYIYVARTFSPYEAFCLHDCPCGCCEGCYDYVDPFQYE